MADMRRGALVHGAIGGLLAGALVAVWFLFVDLAAAEPFRTPAELAAAWLGEADGAITPGRIALYTLLHFGVFAVLGAAASAFLELTDQPPGLLAGVFFGVGVLDAVHYSAMLFTGSQFLTLLPTTHVVLANLAAGVLYMAYLNRAAWREHPLGLEVLEEYPGFRRGLVAGLLGAVAVAAWFFVLDLVAGRPLLTPAALGSALFLGASSPEEVRVTAGIVVGYSVLHVWAFLLAGLAFEWAADMVESTPAVWIIFALGFIVMEAVFVPTAGLLGAWVLDTLSWWAIGVGNLLAVATMGWWIWRAHPGLRRVAREEGAVAGG